MVSGVRLQREHEAGFEGGLGFVVFLHFGEGVETGEIDEGVGVEFVAEFVGEDFGVGVADAEGDEVADVAEDCGADGWGELVDVLVAEGEGEAVFPGFGKDAGEGVGGEVLEFIDE